MPVSDKIYTTQMPECRSKV